MFSLSFSKAVDKCLDSVIRSRLIRCAGRFVFRKRRVNQASISLLIGITRKISRDQIVSGILNRKRPRSQKNTRAGIASNCGAVRARLRFVRRTKLTAVCA